MIKVAPNHLDILTDLCLLNKHRNMSGKSTVKVNSSLVVALRQLKSVLFSLTIVALEEDI